MPLRVRIRIDGMRELLRAFDNLPEDAQQIVRDESFTLAEELAGLIVAAGHARGGQAAMAADTVKAEKGRAPTISAGKRGPKKAKDVLFGSEFGATKRFGWYAAPRYKRTVPRQFPPHRGASSYWFFVTIENNEARIGSAYAGMLKSITDRWGSGG